MTSTYLGDSGIVLAGGGEDEVLDDAGVKWTISGEGPFSRSPSPREVTGENATDHGSWDATEFYGSRGFNLTGKAYAPDHTVLHQAEARFKREVGLSTLVRHVEPGFDRQALFRRSGEVLWTEITDTIAQFSAPLWARDPRAYSTAVKTASTGFPSSAGGLTLPFTLPLIIPATVTSGQLTLVNDGNEEAFPVYRIDGPVTNPGVLDIATGKSWRLKLTLAAGEWITVDTGTHQVLAMGDVNGSRRNLWAGDWFGLAPGTNTLRFTGAGNGPGAQLSVSYRSAWI